MKYEIIIKGIIPNPPSYTTECDYMECDYYEIVPNPHHLVYRTYKFTGEYNKYEFRDHTEKIPGMELIGEFNILTNEKIKITRTIKSTKGDDDGKTL